MPRFARINGRHRIAFGPAEVELTVEREDDIVRLTLAGGGTEDLRVSGVVSVEAAEGIAQAILDALLPREDLIDIPFPEDGGSCP